MKKSPRDAVQALLPAAAALVLLMLGLSSAGPVRAATFQDLYTLTVMPDASQADPRAAAIQSAMRRLLERVTGDRGAALDPDLQSIVEDASSYVRSYATLGGDKAQIGFIASKVDRELASIGRPVWGPERPLTLVWIAVDSGHGERTLLSADGSGAAELSPKMAQLIADIHMQLSDAADERGLPIVLPLLDLQDLGRIGFADVWGGFDERIEQASERYGADSILIGRVLETNLGQDVQWTLLRGAEQRVTSGESVAAGLEWLADQYAQEYSIVGGVRTLHVVVQDVGSLDDYGRVMSYLDSLNSLQSVDVESLENGVLTLRIAARGDTGVLARTLSLGRILQLVDSGSSENGGPGATDLNGDSLGGGGGANTLVFRVARSGPTR
ncbi:MAG TPA: DUF2066 domain-containing protein [Gammaproteobacteria bacterium]|nr:DUF2066 domain-containing protein [Gammaproteobacteria bacterium]